MFDKLKAPFEPSKVSWRVGSMSKDKTKGMALAYIDARDVLERLDEVCGPAGWQNKYPHANGKTVCAIGIKIDGEWIWKENGAGDSDIEAEKGALSDAFKRAAVQWGIGRYLYDVKSPWVELDEYKHIKPHEFARLAKVLGQSAPASAPAKVAEEDPFAEPARKPLLSDKAISFARELMSLKTVADLDAFKRTSEFRAAFKAMSPADQQHLIAAGEQKRHELQSSDFRMAG